MNSKAGRAGGQRGENFRLETMVTTAGVCSESEPGMAAGRTFY